MADQAQLALQPIAAGPDGPHYELIRHDFHVYVYPAPTGQNPKMVLSLEVDMVKSPPGGSAPPPGSVKGLINGNFNTAAKEFNMDTNVQNMVAKIQNINSGGQNSVFRIEFELPAASIPPVPTGAPAKSK